MFDTHVQSVINKANSMLGIIRRTFSFLNKDILLQLYKTLVRPNLEYGNVIWHPIFKRQSVAIEIESSTPSDEATKGDKKSVIWCET